MNVLDRSQIGFASTVKNKSNSILVCEKVLDTTVSNIMNKLPLGGQYTIKAKWVIKDDHYVGMRIITKDSGFTDEEQEQVRHILTLPPA